jgi:hypothetical protein
MGHVAKIVNSKVAVEKKERKKENKQVREQKAERGYISSSPKSAQHDQIGVLTTGFETRKLVLCESKKSNHQAVDHTPLEPKDWMAHADE